MVQTGMVAFRDFGTSDQPTAVTGYEDVLSLPGHVVIVGASGNDINVEVRVGEEGASRGLKVFDGEMEILSGVLSVTEPESPDEESLILPRRGTWMVSVYLESSTVPERLYFIFDADQWASVGRE
ncbi:hypothetical protein ACFWX5_32710 [[Kitasatospora] papulosa]|uniref:hypothetical protein n=1 Tax=Streptomyces TaxID=1883 RepID=UPI003688941C